MFRGCHWTEAHGSNTTTVATKVINNNNISNNNNHNNSISNINNPAIKYHLDVCGIPHPLPELPKHFSKEQAVSKVIEDILNSTFHLPGSSPPELDPTRWVHEGKSRTRSDDLQLEGSKLQEHVVEGPANSQFEAVSLCLYNSTEFAWTLRNSTAKFMRMNVDYLIDFNKYKTWYHNNGYIELTEDVYSKLMQDGTLWGDPLSLQVICHMLEIRCVVLHRQNGRLYKWECSCMCPRHTIFLTLLHDHYNVLTLQTQDISDTVSDSVPFRGERIRVSSSLTIVDADSAVNLTNRGDSIEVQARLPGGWYFDKSIPKAPKQLSRSSSSITSVKAVEDTKKIDETVFREMLSRILAPTLDDAISVLNIFQTIIDEHTEYNDFYTTDDLEPHEGQQENILHRMARTMQEISSDAAKERRALDDADEGNVLFIGYTGIGKSTAISTIFYNDIQRAAANNNNKNIVPKKKEDRIITLKPQRADDLFGNDLDTDESAAVAKNWTMRFNTKAGLHQILPAGVLGSTTALPYYLSYRGSGFAVTIHYKPLECVQQAFSTVKDHFQNPNADQDELESLREAAHMLGLARPSHINRDTPLILPSRFRDRVGAVRRFSVQGSTEYCLDEIYRFLVFNTVGTWSCWGLISKVEVFLPAPSFEGLTVVDAPGFSSSDIYHMNVLSDCLRQGCHALVQLVNGKAIPDDCPRILDDAGVFSHITSRVNHTKVIAAIIADTSYQTSPDEWFDLVSMQLEDDSELNPKEWWRNRLPTDVDEATRNRVVDGIKTLGITMSDKADDRLSIDYLTQEIVQQYQLSRTARVKEAVRTIYKDCIMKLAHHCHSMLNTSTTLQDIKKDNVKLRDTNLELVYDASSFNLDQIRKEKAEDRIREFWKKLQEKPYSQYKNNRVLYKALKENMDGHQLFNLLLGRTYNSFPIADTKTAMKMLRDKLHEASRIVNTCITAATPYLAHKKREFRKDLALLIEQLADKLETETLSVLNIQMAVRADPNVNTALRSLSQQVMYSRPASERLQLLAKLSQQLVDEVYKRTKFIIEREAKQTLFAFRTTSKSMLRKIYRDHAAYHRRSMVEEFVNEADLSLFKRTLIQSCALAKRMKEIFNILEDQVDDESAAREYNTVVSDNADLPFGIYSIQGEERIISSFSNAMQISLPPPPLPPATIIDLTVTPNTISTTLITTTTAATPAPPPDPVIITATTAAPRLPPVIMTATTAAPPLAPVIITKYTKTSSSASSSKRKVDENWLCYNCFRNYEQSGNDRRRLKGREPEGAIACATCALYYNKHKVDRPRKLIERAASNKRMRS